MLRREFDSIQMNDDELKLRMDAVRYAALSPREKYLLNVSHADRDGTPRLVLASTFGDLETVKSLISEGADLNAASHNDMGMRIVRSPDVVHPSPEQIAELEKLMSLIPEEILNQPVVNTPASTLSTALMAASRFGFFEIAEVLLNAGAQIEKEDFRGATALFIAAENRHANIVNLLLTFGANPKHKSTDARTFLHAAVSGGDANLVQVAMQYPFEINAQSDYGDTPLLIASWKRRLDLVEMLLKVGADVNVTDQQGMTPLLATIPDDDWPDRADAKLISLLIEHGANVNAADEKGETALFGAAFYGDFETVKLLTAAGADVTHKDQRGRTPISIAAECDHHDVADFLRQQLSK
jgi:ankyrin repeat protein